MSTLWSIHTPRVFAVSLIWRLKHFYALKNMQIGVQLTRSIAKIT